MSSMHDEPSHGIFLHVRCSHELRWNNHRNILSHVCDKRFDEPHIMENMFNQFSINHHQFCFVDVGRGCCCCCCIQSSNVHWIVTHRHECDEACAVFPVGHTHKRTQNSANWVEPSWNCRRVSLSMHVCVYVGVACSSAKCIRHSAIHSAETYDPTFCIWNYLEMFSIFRIFCEFPDAHRMQPLNHEHSFCPALFRVILKMQLIEFQWLHCWYVSLLIE